MAQAALRTAFPGLANNDVFKSSFTGGLLTGALALLGAFYICLGSTIRVRAAGYIPKKGVTLWGCKIATSKWRTPSAT